MRPDLLDNLLHSHADGLAQLCADPGTAHADVAIATGYVNLGGLHHLAVTITDDRGVRLLLGAVPDPLLGADLPVGRFEQALLVLSGERDLARFPPSRAASQLEAVRAWLERDEVAVRRYLTRFLHGKAYLFGDRADARAALVTSANLTGAGLERNLELGLVRYDPAPAAMALAWFDDLWGKADEFKPQLSDLLFPDPGLIDPQTVYLRALLELYEAELDIGPAPSLPSAVQLAPFQRDGYERARRILVRHHGVVYADGVGTGKTEVGLAFVEEYALRRGQHALVVAPPQLHHNWESRLHQTRLPAQVVSFHDLASDEQLAPGHPHAGRHLSNDRDSYRLVVVDEAHALRNPDTTWYRAMARLLGGARKDLVLLTATPVNNGLWDLYHLILLFGRHDRMLAADGIPSLRATFLAAGANERDPENLDPDVLFPVADAVSVRRDRRFIAQHYPDARFPDGTPVRFPTPHLTTARYDLDAAYPGLVAAITAGIGALSMARYRPSAYARDGAELSREAQLAHLLQSGVLKRFESSWHAARLTVGRMLAAHGAFLAAWDAGWVASGPALRDAAAAELDDSGLAGWVSEDLLDDPDTRPVAEFEPAYREAVAVDRGHLVELLRRLGALSAQDDPKLALLRAHLDATPSQKVAVFASFGDTVAYLDEHLGTAPGGRERVVVIGADTDPDARTAALARFAPETVIAPGYQPPAGEVDLLVATDVLSEGQNLQQAQEVVSYDLPWNPQRVVQRNGRVIRLRSPHTDVRLVTLLPEAGDLELMLGLEATIRRKILAAGVFGMESGVLDEVGEELRAYAVRLQAGDETLLDADAAGEGQGFAGEQLRAELLRAVEEGEVARLRALPWGIGASFRQGAGVPSSGAAGVFFAARTPTGERYWRYVEADRTIVDREAEILRRINPGTPPGTDGTVIGLEEAWTIAADSAVEEHNRRADPRYAEQQLPASQRAALTVLRDPTVALPPGAEVAEAALAVARGHLVHRALAEITRSMSEGTIARDEAARLITAAVVDLGLQPPEEITPLEPITREELGVVCWMTVLAP